MAARFGDREYLFPVDVVNPDYGKPLTDPACAALRAKFPKAKLASLRRVGVPAEMSKAFPDEPLVPAQVSDNWFETSTPHHSGKEWNHGTDLWLSVGQDGRYSSPLLSVLKFDLSGLPKGAKLLGAQIRLTAFPGDFVGTKAGDKLEAYALRQEWYETPQADGAFSCHLGPRYIPNNPKSVKWAKEGADDLQADRFPDPAGTVDPGVFPGNDKYRLMALDITETAKKWHSGEMPNHGVLLKLNSKLIFASSEFQDYVFRPTLVLAYEGTDISPMLTPPSAKK